MKACHILLVEDNEGDILLTTDALEDAKVDVVLDIVRDGSEAISFVNKVGRYASMELPDLILLDVNLPKKSGHEVLQYLKENHFLKDLSVIMLSTSSSEHDIRQSYDQSAIYFLTKPFVVADFIKVIETIEHLCVGIKNKIIKT